MPVPPIDVPIRVDKEAALAAIRETEAAHKVSLDRMDANTKASFAKTRAAAIDLGNQLRAQGGQNVLLGGNPGAFTAEATRATTATVALGRAADNAGNSLSRAVQGGARAMRALSAGIGAATAAAAGSERSFIALGTSVLSAFAAGGPVIGGLSLVAGVLGWIHGNTKEASEAAAAARKSYADWLDSVATKARASAEEVERIADATAALNLKGPAADVLIAQLQVDRARAGALEAARYREYFYDPRVQRSPERVVAEVMRSPTAADYRPGGDPEEQRAAKELVDRVEDLRAAEAKLAALRKNEAASAVADSTKADREKIEAVEKLTDGLRREIQVLEQKTALERETMAAIQERDAALESGVPASVANARLALKVDEARTAEAARYKAEIEDRAREEERAGKALADYLDEEIAAREKLEKTSAEYLEHARGALATEKATEGVERDRVEAELEVAAAIAAGTLAAKDQGAALQLLLDLAKTRRDNADAKESAAKAEREKEDALRKAEQEAEVRAGATEDVERQLRALRAANDVEREILAIEDKIADLRKKGVPENLLGQLQSELVKKALAGSDPVRAYLDSIAPTLTGGLSDLIADGIETGFKNAADIGQQIWRTLLRQLLNDLVGSGLKEGLGALFGGGGGSGGGIFASLFGALIGGAGGGAGSAVGSVVSAIGGGGGGGGYWYSTGGPGGGGYFETDPGLTPGGWPGWSSGYGLAEGGITTRAQRRLIGESGPELVLPLHKAPEVLQKLGGGRAGSSGSFVLNIGSMAPGLLDLPTHLLARVVGDGVARALQRRGDVRRAVGSAGKGSL